MKRFWTEATVTEADGQFGVALDGRPVKTQGGRALRVPGRALAAALAGEWAAQGTEVDPAGFAFRDLADLAIDVIAADRADTVATLLRYAETDTLCYRAEPGEPLHARQLELWEPLLNAAEARFAVPFIRTSGVIHQPQPAATLARLKQELTVQGDFALAALTALTTLPASLVIGLAALQGAADPGELWRAAELEEDWQAEQWGQDDEAQIRRARRLASFTAAVEFAQLARA